MSSSGKRGRGRPKLKKEDIFEDYCFTCKDGGELLVCDFKHCVKAYHPSCVGKDENFVRTGKKWVCDRHSCFICRRSSMFHCFVCTVAVCRPCIHSAEFVAVRGKNGFCANCLRLAKLIEEDVDVDSDGGTVDFKERDTYEYLFKGYWDIMKEKENLTLEDLWSAHALLKKGRSFKKESDSDKLIEREDGDQDFDASMDVDVDIESCLTSGKELKLFTPRKHSRKVKTKKREFIGWGSKPLRDFLKSIGKDTDNPISQNEVSDIISKYINENGLNHPEKKKERVLCDPKLHSIFGRKSVNRNKIFDLLEPHFAENMEQTEEDELSYDSDEDDNSSRITCKRQRRTSLEKNTVEKVTEATTRRNCFASLTSKNIKLVYLTRRLVEDLLKHPETFDHKVVGCFVRVKSDRNNNILRNPYQLMQVSGITKSHGNDNVDVTLHVSSMNKDYKISMLSNEDFLEEEIEDLQQNVKDGLLEKPTIVELERKARIIHEDRTKHWINRELVRLRNLIDRANEKGWRRELLEYMERMELLQTSAEQERLIRKIPEVIAEEIEVEVASLDVPNDENPASLDVLKDENPVQDSSPRSILTIRDSTRVDEKTGNEDANRVNVDVQVMPDSSIIEVNADDTDRKAAEKLAEGTGVIFSVSNQDELGFPENADATDMNPVMPYSAIGVRAAERQMQVKNKDVEFVASDMTRPKRQRNASNHQEALNKKTRQQKYANQKMLPVYTVLSATANKDVAQMETDPTKASNKNNVSSDQVVDKATKKGSLSEALQTRLQKIGEVEDIYKIGGEVMNQVIGAEPIGILPEHVDDLFGLAGLEMVNFANIINRMKTYVHHLDERRKELESDRNKIVDEHQKAMQDILAQNNHLTGELREARNAAEGAIGEKIKLEQKVSSLTNEVDQLKQKVNDAATRDAIIAEYKTTSAFKAEIAKKAFPMFEEGGFHVLRYLSGKGVCPSVDIASEAVLAPLFSPECLDGHKLVPYVELDLNRAVERNPNWIVPDVLEDNVRKVFERKEESRADVEEEAEAAKKGDNIGQVQDA